MPDGAELHYLDTTAPDPLPIEEKNTLSAWITAMPDPNSAVLGSGLPIFFRPFLDDIAVFNVIFTDISKLRPESVDHFRYLSLVNLYNDPKVTPDMMEVFRQGLFKAVNSLSLKTTLVRPEAIDNERTVYRINLQSLGWKPELWDKIAGNNSYKRFSENIAYKVIASSLKTPHPILRADWFVSKSMKPPFYYDFLNIPEKVDDLEKFYIGRTADQDLIVNSDEISRIGIGLNHSGVSDFNRLIERHSTSVGGGYYWRSFDFRGRKTDVNSTVQKSDRRDIFTFPLGPGKGPHGEDGFVQDGGEIIFGLPNGMQGYMLVDATGKRIDQGPPDIVYLKNPPPRRSRDIVDGITCVSCHANGINRATDELLAHVQAVQPGFEIVQQVAAWHDIETAQRWINDDSSRFTAALARLGIMRLGRIKDATNPDKIFEKEQITYLVDHFELGLIDLVTASAEIGVPLLQLKSGIAKGAASEEQRLLDGGVLDRLTFENVSYNHIAELIGLRRTPVDFRPEETVKLGVSLEQAERDKGTALKNLTAAIEQKTTAEEKLQAVDVRLGGMRATVEQARKDKANSEALLNAATDKLAKLRNMEVEYNQAAADVATLKKLNDELNRKILSFGNPDANFQSRVADLQLQKAAALRESAENHNALLRSQHELEDMKKKFDAIPKSDTTVAWMFYGFTDPTRWSNRSFMVVMRNGSVADDAAVAPEPNDTVEALSSNINIRNAPPVYAETGSGLGIPIGKLKNKDRLRVTYSVHVPNGYWIGVKLSEFAAGEIEPMK